MTEKDKMQTDCERPLISFVLLSYNQERFIAEAVEAVLAQTYQPLEILLSDDCSGDRTFEIMSEIATSYRGPHQIVLNRNPKNLGIGAHLNRALELARGELVVGGAGDDVSVPERTEAIYRLWLESGRTAHSLFSDAQMMDEDGNPCGMLYGDRRPSLVKSVETAVKRGGIGAPGCTHVFSKKTFDMFGPMDPQVMAEDMVIPFRSLLLGGLVYTPEPLVRYRTHGGNVSINLGKRPSVAWRCREKTNQEAVLITWLKDVRTACSAGLIAQERADALLREIYSTLELASMEKTFLRQGWGSGLRFLLSRITSGRVSKIFKMIDRRMRCS